MYFTEKGEFAKAFEVILKTNPFPAVTGMVCDHLCQNKCTRVNYDDPLMIREIKRFISEQNGIHILPDSRKKKKVAVIGAGPSGLSCAFYLSLAGFETEVFEQKSKAGGMVQFAIPGFRLTDEAIEKDLERIIKAGVAIHYNSPVDKTNFEKLRKNFDYIFIGAGAQLSKNLNIEGIGASGVLEPLDFLFNAKKGKPTGAGKNVVIIGGGNTAMDAARTAFRLVGEDGKVTVVYRRSTEQMPADQGEIKAVLDEGMEIIELAGPEKIIRHHGKVKALLCSKMKLSEADSSGRPKPVKIENSEFEIPCDTVIPAIGQNLNIDFMTEEQLQADKDNHNTRIDNIFIGGDALRGASTAINAIADGRKTAARIMKLENMELSLPFPEDRKKHDKNELMLKRAKRRYANHPEELSLDNRKNFLLVSKTLDQQAAVNEAQRCLFCDEICNICTTVCPNFANFSYETRPVKYQLQKMVKQADGKTLFIEDGNFQISQQYQILNIANFCNECGNCRTFCPADSAPYIEKPHVYLTQNSFDENDEGYFAEKKEGYMTLWYKNNGRQHKLSEKDNSWTYKNDDAEAQISKKDFKILEARFTNPEAKDCSFCKAAEMSIILKGAKNLLSLS